jgi:hypothetical protein
MKLIHKLTLALVAVAALGLATPAQAWPFHRHFVGVYVQPYGGYVYPDYAYYGPPPYYNPYYSGYYGPRIYGGGIGFAFGGHGYYHGGYGGFRGGYHRR